MYQQPQSNSKPSSYLSPHPQITKRLSNTPTPRLQIPQQQYNKKRQQLYCQQQRMNFDLKDKLQHLQHQNTLFKQSLMYFDPTQILSQLQRQLLYIRNKQVSVSKQIENCQIVQRTTTPQQYFLFKKNKRVQSFNQAINEMYEEVDKQRQGIRQMMQRIAQEMASVKVQIDKMQEELNNNNRQDNQFKSRRQQQQNDNSQQQQQQEYNQQTNNNNKNRESICESRVNVIVQSAMFLKQHQQQQQNINNKSFSQQSSQSSIQPYELQHLKQQYKSLLQTYQIISQNNQIMTTQLFNNIDSIEDSLYKYYDTETNKLYRDLLLIKQDFSYMPLQHIIPPTQTQLNYSTTPLIHDYKNKLTQIKNKLSTDLKRITTDILTPLKWENISIQEYLQIDPNDNQDDDKDIQHNYLLKSTQNNKKIKQAQIQYSKIQQSIKKQDQIISNLQSQLQQIMGDTMVFKQKQHQLQLAMNNMKKLLRQQKLQNPPILF